MYTVRAIYQESRWKDYIPIYVFIDCAVSFKHFGNYCFSKNPKAAFIAHYHEEGKNTKMKETFQSLFWYIFFRYKGNFLKHIKHCSGRPGFVYAFQNDQVGCCEKYLKFIKDFPFTVVGG